jgi:hypothetical protein
MHARSFPARPVDRQRLPHPGEHDAISALA